MQISNVNSQRPNFNQSFGAVNFSRSVKKYPRLMETLIESPYIKKFIAENEARGVDTDIYINTDLASCTNLRFGPYFRIASSDNPYPIMDTLIRTSENVEGIINNIKFKDCCMLLPEKMKKFGEWVKIGTKE